MKIKFMIVVAFGFSILGSYFIGFSVGSEKMWANASAYNTVGAVTLLSGWSMPEESELKLREHERKLRGKIDESIQVYGRFVQRWESKVPSGSPWERSTEGIMDGILTWYEKDTKLDYRNISFGEYWVEYEKRDPEFYYNLKVSDSDLYEELKVESKEYLKNIQAALKSRQ